MDELLSDPAEERRCGDYGHVLLVDDDAQLRLLVARFLERYGFIVTSAQDGTSARETLERGTFDLVILDVMLPGITGIEICRELRATSNLPIIMLTARSDDVTRVAGLEGGADDYVTKPFNPREFLARVRSLLRRARLNTRTSHETQPNRATFGQWSLDFMRRELISPQGALIDLSTGEYDLLVVFV
ncbi:MAG TPA: response regulator, partial [Accumulibacter sp.]|nr:response regulator [Accumulibacter sp.]